MMDQHNKVNKETWLSWSLISSKGHVVNSAPGEEDQYRIQGETAERIRLIAFLPFHQCDWYYSLVVEVRGDAIDSRHVKRI